MIKAPFNFVPLSDKVYFPEWADQVSQDVPFEDGVSGTIELKITAQTPIFVRNGYTKEDADAKNDQYKSFSKTTDNKYFIPATTIKGCIRNVLEIMSFGKMTQVQDSSFGLRDLNNSDYRNQMKNIQCGWLQEKSDGYVLYDWGEPGRISVEAIDKQFNTKLVQFVKGDNFRDDSNKTAKYKYMLTNAESSCKVAKFCEDVELQQAKLKANKIEPRKFYKFGGNQEGVLVFTGQPSQRKIIQKTKKWTGKYYEFVFLKPQNEQFVKLPDNLINEFKTIHAESPDYKNFWYQKLRKGEKIPVFFKKNGGKIHSIGLAYMYKYPFENSVYDAIPKELKNPNISQKNKFGMDLAECMFGYSWSDDALKGRIQFGHAFAMGQQTPLAEKVFVSATPHASFYPLYVENGSDWNHAQKISGRKRYPIRDQENYNNVGTANMTQICSMLNKGAMFTEKIYFHNLKKVELGALLSAITFHGMNDKCFHNLGFGKSYGYGKIRISGVKLNFVDATINECMLEYEETMGHFVATIPSVNMNNHQFAKLSKNDSANNWLASIQLQELVAMAIGIPKGMDKDFQYLKMSTRPLDNEFKKVKDDRESLDLFTKITGKKVSIDSVKSLECSLKEDDTEKTGNPISTINPTELKVGDVRQTKCIAEKKVIIDGYEVPMVVPKESFVSPQSLVGKEIMVKIVQISRLGKVCQVKFLKS